MSKTISLKAPLLKPPTRTEMMKMLRPHATLIGEIVFCWNGLHENLANVFWGVTNIANGLVSQSIWHSLASDIAQRKMLKAAVMARYAEDSKEYIDICWVIEQINDLSINRNSSIHAPLAFVTDITGTSLMPSPHSQNIYAKRLAGKDLIEEFTLYIDRLSLLSTYARDLWASLFFPEHHAWPKRPPLQDLKRQGHHEGKPSRQRSAKAPLPRRGPSPK